MYCNNYVGLACVDGSCPMAIAEEYKERNIVISQWRFDVKKNIFEFAFVTVAFLYVLSGCYKLGFIPSMAFCIVTFFMLIFIYTIWFRYLRKIVRYFYVRFKKVWQNWREAFEKAQD